MIDAQDHIISADNIVFGYSPALPVLRSVSFTAAAGRMLCILGPNGSGKTTLLRCLLGRLKPDKGEILLDGDPIAGYSPKGLASLLAYVPQIPSSAFAFTVKELVLMGRFARTGAMGLAGRNDLAVARQAMVMTDTLDFAERMISELSGGEAQRAMIARALTQQPRVCLLDEPTSHLDIRNQMTIYKMMTRLAHDWKMAVVCVSHDVNLAARFADELVIMREGEVIAAGPPSRVVKHDVLEEAYEVQIDLIDIPGCDVPLVRAR